MKISDQSQEIEKNSESSEWEFDHSQEMISHRSYHEMSDRPVVEMDQLAQLKFQMNLLLDLQARQSFLMREIRYLMKI